jgi:branched-chain amino acid transport system substrate-binding protein
MGARHYFEYINEKGGINGQRIELLHRDSQYQPAVALTGYRDLLSKGIVALMGWGTGSSALLSPHVRRDKIPFIPASFSNALVTPINPYLFLAASSYTDEFITMLRYIKEHPKVSGRNPTVVFITNSSAYGRAPIRPGTAAAREMGIDVVRTIEVELGAQEADSQMADLKSINPDYAINVGIAGNTAAILKSAKSVGLTTTFMGVYYAGDEKVIELAGAAADGYLAVCPYSRWYENVSGFNVIRQFCKENYPEMTEWPMFYIGGWVVASIFAEAIEKAGPNPTGEAIKTQLENISYFYTNGLSDVIRFSPTDHKASSKVKILRADSGTGRYVPITGWVE